jgi:hypothetical protein
MPMRRAYPSVNQEEIDKLKALLKSSGPPQPSKPPEPTAIQSPKPPGPKYNPKRIFEETANLDASIEPLRIDNPVKLLMILMPELTPYRWQFEELMRTAGYLTTGDYDNKATIDDQHPYMLVLPAANGSGKDMIMIAAFAVWFMLTGVKNRTIITSSSQDQTKFQTEPSIRELCNRANKKLCAPGQKLIHYVQFHYVCPELGSEIKLYATDEAARAEGYHPFFGGKMALIINEAKSVKPEIFDAVSRCTGYSYWMEISSPGRRSGHMYDAATSAVEYPNSAVLGKWYTRRVTAMECPHIPPAHIERMIYERGENDPWVRSSIFAEFSDFDEPVVITDWVYKKCVGTPIADHGDDIGIGVDFGGGGDENSCWVRKGNRIVFNYNFSQKDTTIAADLIDLQLSPWKNTEYTFNADNGGIGQAFIDNLKKRGWKINRRNNQSPAFRKNEFLNLGAEMWFHTKRLMERCDIVIPKVEP